MALSIQSNIGSLLAQNSLYKTQTQLQKSFERLSSGFRINSAADDAAGLGISTSLNAQVRSYSVAERNTNNGVSLVQTAEGGLGQIHNILTRMRELAVQGANGDLTSTDRGYLEVEFYNLKSEIVRIADSTVFNGKSLLANTTQSAVVFHVGINTVANTDSISVDYGGVTLTVLTVDGSTLSGSTSVNALSAIASVDAAIKEVSTRRSNFGAIMNRLSTTVSNIQSIRTNLSSALSRIRDVDVAEETAHLARSQVLAQAGAAVLAQANQQPQLALSLLQ